VTIEELIDDIEMPLKFFAILSLDTLFNSIFLAIWAIIQFILNYVLGLLQLEGFDGSIIRLAQIVFAVTTFIPILMYYYMGLRVGWIRIHQRIDRERRKREIENANSEFQRRRT